MTRLSRPQTAIYEMYLFGEDGVANIVGDIFFKEPVAYSEGSLANAINELIRRCEVLRTRIVIKDGVPLQHTVPYASEGISVLRFASQVEYNDYANTHARERMDIEGKLYEFNIISIDGKMGMFCMLHHIIADAWTMSILADRLCEYLRIGSMSSIAPYSMFLASEDSYLDSARHIRDKAYWLSQYANQPETAYMSDRHATSKTANRISATLSAEDSKQIRSFCSENSISEYTLFMAAVAALLYRYTDSEAFYLGTTVLNRSTMEEKEMAGACINSVPLAVSVNDATTFGGLCEQISCTITSAFRHQRFLYSDILKLLRAESGLEGTLYDVIVSFQNIRMPEEAVVRWYASGAQEESLQIHIDDRNGEGTYHIDYDYQTEKFSENAIWRLHAHLMNLLRNGIDVQESAVYGLTLMLDAEYRQVTVDFNDTHVDYPREKTVHQLFEEQVERTPDATAVIACDKTLSYHELNEAANRIAHGLISCGVNPGNIVAFMLHRKSYLIAAMLGILKSGAAYMPIDPDYPQERIDYMLEDSHASFFITEAVISDLIQSSYYENPCVLIPKYALYCCLHTSGSTGKPKMTLLSHSNIVNHIYANKQFWNNIDTVIALSIVTFDACIMDTILSIVQGYRVILASEEQMYEQSQFEALFSLSSNNFMFATPTKMRSYIRNSPDPMFLRSITSLVLGGEVFDRDLYCLITEMSACTAIYNIYGPTETTIDVLFKELTSDDITIGSPIANAQIYIVDKYMRPVPIGVKGELCIAGDCVGAGYLNQPELTAERFLDNPFGEGKLYKTGDLAKWREDGEVEYIGRNDFQVKIRGLRIELGEIEAAISYIEGIRQVVVVVRKDRTGRQLICAFFTGEQLDVGFIRRELSMKLPIYMLPHIITHIDSLPMTSSGKVNRNALPEVALDGISSAADYVAPATETERILCSLIEEVLGCERVGTADNYFDLGGDSLKAIELVAKLHQRMGASISVQSIFKHSQVSELAALIGHDGIVEEGISAHGATRYPLLPQQAALYAACQKNGSLAYNMPVSLDISHLDKERLCCALQTLFARHEAFHTSVEAEDDALWAVINENTVLAFETVTCEANFIRPFDLHTAPLLRVGFGEGRMYMDMHHIISDGTSIDILLDDLERLYNEQILPEKHLHFSDYALDFHERAESGKLASHKDFFIKQLAGDIGPVELPTSKHTGESIGQSGVMPIDADTMRHAKNTAKVLRITDTALFLGVYGLLLSQYGATDEVFTSVSLTNRTHGQVQDMVGMFVNTLPVLLNVHGTQTQGAYLRQVNDILIGLYEHQEYPFLLIAEDIHLTDKNVMNTSFVYQAGGGKALSLGGQQTAPTPLDTPTAKFGLSFEVTPTAQGGLLRYEFDAGLYDATLIQGMAEGYIR